MINKVLNQYIYYALIITLSLICLFFLPMLGSTAGLSFQLPTTAVGWVIWVASNISSAILNVLMFHLFIKQAKLNIRDNEAYKQANKRYQQHEASKAVLPLSPHAWHAKQYKKKGISLFLFTILGAISFGQAILVFDLVKFLTQLITLVIGVVFGIIQMKTTEDYWTIEFPEYVDYYELQQAAIPNPTPIPPQAPVPAVPAVPMTHLQAQQIQQVQQAPITPPAPVQPAQQPAQPIQQQPVIPNELLLQLFQQYTGGIKIDNPQQ